MESLRVKEKGFLHDRGGSFDEQEQKHRIFDPFLSKTCINTCCLFSICSAVFYNQPEEKVFAYVSVDINPSLEVSVTKDFRVIDLQACNDDGRRILKEKSNGKINNYKK